MIKKRNVISSLKSPKVYESDIQTHLSASVSFAATEKGILLLTYHDSCQLMYLDRYLTNGDDTTSSGLRIHCTYMRTVLDAARSINASCSYYLDMFEQLRSVGLVFVSGVHPNVLKAEADRQRIRQLLLAKLAASKSAK